MRRRSRLSPATPAPARVVNIRIPTSCISIAASTGQPIRVDGRRGQHDCETGPATAVAWHTTDTAVSNWGQEQRDGGPPDRGRPVVCPATAVAGLIAPTITISILLVNGLWPDSEAGLTLDSTSVSRSDEARERIYQQYQSRGAPMAAVTSTSWWYNSGVGSRDMDMRADAVEPQWRQRDYQS